MHIATNLDSLAVSVSGAGHSTHLHTHTCWAWIPFTPLHNVLSSTPSGCAVNCMPCLLQSRQGLVIYSLCDDFWVICQSAVRSSHSGGKTELYQQPSNCRICSKAARIDTKPTCNEGSLFCWTCSCQRWRITIHVPVNDLNSFRTWINRPRYKIEGNANCKTTKTIDKLKYGVIHYVHQKHRLYTVNLKYSLKIIKLQTENVLTHKWDQSNWLMPLSPFKRNLVWGTCGGWQHYWNRQKWDHTLNSTSQPTAIIHASAS